MVSASRTTVLQRPELGCAGAEQERTQGTAVPAVKSGHCGSFTDRVGGQTGFPEERAARETLCQPGLRQEEEAAQPGRELVARGVRSRRGPRRILEGSGLLRLLLLSLPRPFELRGRAVRRERPLGTEGPGGHFGEGAVAAAVR